MDRHGHGRKARGPQAWDLEFLSFFMVRPQAGHGRHPKHPHTCSSQQNRRRKKGWKEGVRPFAAEEAGLPPHQALLSSEPPTHHSLRTNQNRVGPAHLSTPGRSAKLFLFALFHL